MANERMTDDEALDYVIEQLGALVLLRTMDRGRPGVLMEGPDGEMIVVYAQVPSHLLVSRLEHLE
jgi:hypothetical protein